ncbi:SAICAR synthase-like protein [Microthyrium microscopicum]|uniref:SAICAR synthase-like protein n=1 Tax=Microthyrium microscopicum TaxID=703497 RepID=A0A6A6U652_9PEZI|nr:SAICAR synthase-like protein [Microthyrium microscopicum]
MGRQANISRAILQAIHDDDDGKKKNLARILYFFKVIDISLTRFRPDVFEHLRRIVWEFDVEDYRQSFNTDSLKPTGDLGYSGSTFFTTQDAKYLIKSLPRRSEYHFFKVEMLDAYASHMAENPESLLVRITDFLHAPRRAIGSILRITPAHHIVMENILFGKDEDDLGEEWETYDLKPVSYFYPERDLAGGHLASDAVKERLLDTFDDRVRVSKKQKDILMDQLASDSKLLMDVNVVDYSLFLVRYPAAHVNAREIPEVDARASAWRSGIKSSDGRWIYRAVILDFFWAKHKFHAMAMTVLIRSFNFISGKGHMSITTDAADYRKRFLQMVETLFEHENRSDEMRNFGTMSG